VPYARGVCPQCGGSKDYRYLLCSKCQRNNRWDEYEDRIIEVLDLLRYGESVEQVCKRVNWSPGAVSRTMRRHGYIRESLPFERLASRIKRARARARNERKTA
jgi:hypothetical protein